MSALPSRRPLDRFAAAVMLSLCMCWGLQQVAIKAAAPFMNPTLQVGIRSLLAAVLIVGLMLSRRDPLSLRDGTMAAGIAAGLLFGGEFLAVALGLSYTSASHMAVFLYTAPAFTALGLHWLVKGEHLRPAQWTGVGVAFAGIVVAFSSGLFGPHAAGHQVLLGDGLGILGGILWAATTIVVRASKLSEASPSKTLLYQLVGAAVLLLLVSLWKGDTGAVTPTPALWWSLAFQTVVVAFISYLTWFWMLRHYRASQLSVFSFLTPLFGVGFGAALLHEPLDPRFVIGALCVLAGITMVNRRPAA